MSTCQAKFGFHETMIFNGLHDFLRVLSEIYSREQDNYFTIHQLDESEDQSCNCPNRLIRNLLMIVFIPSMLAESRWRFLKQRHNQSLS